MKDKLKFNEVEPGLFTATNRDGVLMGVVTKVSEEAWGYAHLYGPGAGVVESGDFCYWTVDGDVVAMDRAPTPKKGAIVAKLASEEDSYEEAADQLCMEIRQFSKTWLVDESGPLLVDVDALGLKSDSLESKIRAAHRDCPDIRDWRVVKTFPFSGSEEARVSDLLEGDE